MLSQLVEYMAIVTALLSPTRLKQTACKQIRHIFIKHIESKLFRTAREYSVTSIQTQKVRWPVESCYYFEIFDLLVQ